MPGTIHCMRLFYFCKTRLTLSRVSTGSFRSHSRLLRRSQIFPQVNRHFHKAVDMSSDEAYGSFLDQANQSTSNKAKTSSSSKSKAVSTKAVDTEVPASLQSIDAFYTSDADEKFEPVSLQWGSGNMPSESQYFASSILDYLV